MLYQGKKTWQYARASWIEPNRSANAGRYFDLQSLLALDTKLPGGHCLTHVGREGAFYTETDMHGYLHHCLYSGGLENGLYRTVEGRDTILLHKEYPTVARYRRGPDGRLEESLEGRRRGAFEISIWDPRFIGEREHRKQKVLCAAELAPNECGARGTHTLNDATKLAGPSNEIRYGYLLFFVRDHPEYKRNEKKITDSLRDAAKRERVLFCEVDGPSKPKPTFLGAWGTV